MNNTFCVALQVEPHTNRSVTDSLARLHNLCMARKREKPKTGTIDETAKLSGQRIRDARERRGWTQEQLAKETGWTDTKPSRAQPTALAPSRIANFEQGTRRVGLEEAEILARTFRDYPAPYWMGVISEQEGAVIAAMRQGSQPLSPSPRPLPPTGQIPMRGTP